jgi:hypothetical protein
MVRIRKIVEGKKDGWRKIGVVGPSRELYTCTEGCGGIMEVRK